jgi:recombinational DNA repair ATPase RecF
MLNDEFTKAVLDNSLVARLSALEKKRNKAISEFNEAKATVDVLTKQLKEFGASTPEQARKVLKEMRRGIISLERRLGEALNTLEEESRKADKREK